MNLLHLISSIIVWTAFYAAAENDPRNNGDNVRTKRNGIIETGVYQPRYYYPNNNNYYSPQPNYYPSQYYAPSRSSYYPSTYQAQPSKYYYYPQQPVAPTPGNVIKSLISRQDGPLNPYGYKNPYYGTTNRPRKKKKKLFVPNVWG